MCEKYLENLYANQQDIQYKSKQVRGDGVFSVSEPTHAPFVDGRLKFINQTQYRNDIELFKFDPDADCFGDSSASIEEVYLLNEESEPLSWVVGGEFVQLKINALANRDLHSVIVGFFVKDGLGQNLFGDNTSITYRDRSVSISSAQSFSTSFYFNMPTLPIGSYSVTIAIAEGVQEEYVQCCWRMHDALVFKSHSGMCAGLVGIPMLGIRITGKE